MAEGQLWTLAVRGLLKAWRTVMMALSPCMVRDLRNGPEHRHYVSFMPLAKCRWRLKGAQGEMGWEDSVKLEVFVICH